MICPVRDRAVMFVTDTSERNYSLTGGRFARTAHAELSF
jgi:hypothetical protein